MPTEKNQTWLPVVLIAGALAGWGLILAVGAYSAQIGETGGGDHRKLWVVAATTGGFLLLWGLVLLIHQVKLRRQAKLRRRRRSQPTDSNDQRPPP